MTGAEAEAVARIVAVHHERFPYRAEERLQLYDEPDDGKVLSGATKMPSDLERLLPVVAHVLDSVTALRRRLPDAEWQVQLDDLDAEWSDARGYELPGMRDAELMTWLGGS